MKALITGATGFIGSHVAERLLREGWEALCLSRDPFALRHLQGLPVATVDLAGLESRLESGERLDYVIHLAGATRGLNYEEYRRANVGLTQRLLELLDGRRVKNHLQRFLLVSSQAAAGPCSADARPVTESDEPAPVSLYGRSKLEAEALALSFKDRLPVTVVRPPTVFGPRDRDVLGVFKCARFRIAPCLSGPDRLVSVVYVEDLVDGALAAALSPAAEGQIYFIANPEPVVWRRFSLDVARIMGYRSMAAPIPMGVMKACAAVGDLVGTLTGAPALFRSEKLEEMAQLAWVCSAEKAARELNWRAATPLEEAVRKTATWYRENGWI